MKAPLRLVHPHTLSSDHIQDDLVANVLAALAEEARIVHSFAQRGVMSTALEGERLEIAARRIETAVIWLRSQKRALAK